MGSEGQRDCDVSVGRRESQGHPTVPLGTLGWEGQWDCDVSAGTQESWGHPTVPRGLWDVLTGLRNGDGKSGQHSM